MSLIQNPFRAFFPMGTLLGIVGVSPWMILYFDPTKMYPLTFHREILMGGFLLSFVIGFLTTAIPRFSASDFLKKSEFSLLFLFLIAGVFATFLGSSKFHHFFATLTYGILLLFFLRRFRKRGANPPFTFVFVPAGILLGIAANMGLALLFQEAISENFFFFFRSIYADGVILSLVLGIGGRLMPALLGWDEIVIAQRALYEKPLPFLSVVPIRIWIALLLFLTSYAWLGMGAIQEGRILKALVVLFIAFSYWRLHNLPKKRVALAYGIWIAGWFFVLGSLAPIFWDSGTHVYHITLVGGFSLLTFMVATRVTVSHGHAKVDLDKKAWVLQTLIALLVLATITRVSAILMPNSYFNHLAYSSAVWVLGVLIWAFHFVSAILQKPNDTDKANR